MTIQRLLLCGLSGLLLPISAADTATAQCSRVRPIHITSPYGQRPLPYRTAWEPHHVQRPVSYPVAPPSPAGIEYGGFSHVDELAARLEVLMNELCLDLYYNYSHNPGFRETYAEAYSLYNTAKFIHAAEHQYDRTSVQRSLAGVDALFHHVQDDVRGWTRIPRRQIGTLGIVTKIQMAEETLHHLMDDVGVQSLPAPEEPPIPGGFPGAPAGGGFPAGDGFPAALSVPSPPQLP